MQLHAVLTGGNSFKRFRIFLLLHTSSVFTKLSPALCVLFTPIQTVVPKLVRSEVLKVRFTRFNWVQNHCSHQEK